MAKEKDEGIYFKVSEKERKLIDQRMEEAGIKKQERLYPQDVPEWLNCPVRYSSDTRLQPVSECGIK